MQELNNDVNELKKPLREIGKTYSYLYALRTSESKFREEKKKVYYSFCKVQMSWIKYT